MTDCWAGATNFGAFTTACVVGFSPLIGCGGGCELWLTGGVATSLDALWLDNRYATSDRVVQRAPRRIILLHMTAPRNPRDSLVSGTGCEQCAFTQRKRETTASSRPEYGRPATLGTGCKVGVKQICTVRPACAGMWTNHWTEARRADRAFWAWLHKSRGVADIVLTVPLIM